MLLFMEVSFRFIYFKTVNHKTVILSGNTGSCVNEHHGKMNEEWKNTMVPLRRVNITCKQNTNLIQT